jgi:hypothetical protein
MSYKDLKKAHNQNDASAKALSHICDKFYQEFEDFRNRLNEFVDQEKE